MTEKLIEISEYFLKQYKESILNPSKTLEGHINHENSIINDYQGRAIFELFQNAIDRAEDKIWIKLDKNKRTLIVANNGDPFSIKKESGRIRSDFDSLCSIDTSNKNQNESIGNKGVGFKSYWEYTKRITICSIHNNLKWGFEFKNPVKLGDLKDYLKNFIEDYSKNKLEDLKQLDKWSDKDYSEVLERHQDQIPSFYFPRPIENAENYFELFEGAKTVIQLNELTDEKLVDIENKIEEFSKHQIFFAIHPNKQKQSNISLELQIDDSPKKILNTKVNTEEWLIESLDFIEGEQFDELQRLSSIYKYKIEKPRISIAFPLKQSMVGEHIQSNFYCYLPTEVKCGFNVLIHGDFYLDVSRKRIDFKDNNYNKKLLEYIIRLFIDTLIKRTELHNLPYFGKFIFPDSPEAKIEIGIEKMFRNEFFGTSKITTLLKNAYTSDRKWNIDSYSLVFDVIDRWKPSVKLNII